MTSARVRTVEAALLVVLVAPLAGCIAPGSAIGHLSIRGSLQTASGRPLPEREVQFLLPRAYGLGGLDLVLGDPEDFGHRDRSFSVVTDANGEFSHDLGKQIHHITFWLVPPLGGFPRHPPPPFLLVRVPSFPGEYYAVQTEDGRFKMFAPGGAELPSSSAQLVELGASSESGRSDDGRWTVGVIRLRFREH